MSIGLIILCVWLVGIPIVFFGSAIFDESTDSRTEYLYGAAIMSVFWPVLIPIFCVVGGRIALYNYVVARKKAKALHQKEKLRIQSVQEDTLKHIEEELDYRTMPCNSCGHKVEQTQ